MTTPHGESADKRAWLLAMIPVAVIAAFAELGTAVLNNSTLPIYYNIGLGIAQSVFPLLMIPFFVSEGLFKLPFGVLSDKFGRKPLMLLGTTVTIFTPIAMVLIHRHGGSVTKGTLFALAGLRLLDGLGGAALWPALYSYVGDVIKENRRNAALSLLNGVYMAALSLGFLAGGLVDDYFGPVFTGDSTLSTQLMVARRQSSQSIGHLVRAVGHRLHPNHLQAETHHPLMASISQQPVIVRVPAAVDPLFHSLSRPEHYFPSFFLVSVLFAICSCTIVIGLKNPRPSNPHHDEHHFSWLDFKTAVQSVPQYMILAFVAFFGIGCIAPLVKLYIVREFHIPEHQVGVLMLGPTCIIGGIVLSTCNLADKYGKILFVRGGFSICALGLWLIPLLHFRHGPEIGFVIVASIIGVGAGWAVPSWTALLTTICTDKSRGTVIGAVSTAQGVGMLFGFAVGPWLATLAGQMAPFFAAAFFVSVGAIMAFLLIHEQKKPIELMNHG